MKYHILIIAVYCVSTKYQMGLIEVVNAVSLTQKSSHTRTYLTYLVEPVSN